MGKAKNQRTFNELIVEKITILQLEDRHATAHNYRTLLHFIEKHYGILRGCDVTPSLVKSMRAKYMGGMSPSTVSSYLACLKSIFNYACYKGICDERNYPFQRKAYELDKVKLPRIAKRNDSYLTKENMDGLYAYWRDMPTDKPKYVTKKKMLGLFLCSYLCNGANLNDVLRLKYGNSYWNSNGRVLTFVRHKVSERTGAEITVPIIQPLKEILDYVADEPTKNGYLFKSFMDVDFDNEEMLLKKIMYINSYASKLTRSVCAELGIRDDVSVTFARHTYATVMHQSGAPFSLVETNMGHTSGIAFNYIGRTGIDDLFKWNSVLLTCCMT